MEHRRITEVIDLVSDDDSNVDAAPAPRTVPQMDIDSDTDSVPYRTPGAGSGSTTSDIVEHYARPLNPHRPQGGTIMVVDDEEIFIPDEDEPPDAGPNIVNDPNLARDRDIALSLDNARVVTADECLQRVLEIFPDISHDYVNNLYNDFDHEGDYETLPGSARLDNIIEQLVSATSYPKQEKGKKRKRGDSIEGDPAKQWAREDRVPVPHYLKGSMQAMLKAEFPDIPVQYINDTLATQRHLYQAFLALAKTKDDQNHSNRPYGRGRPSTKHLADATTIATNCGWPELLDELNAARKRVQAIREERAEEEMKKLAEQENLRRAIDAGETAECSACFDDLPMNRQIHCNGSVAHFTCFECAETYVKSEVGESRCCVVCPAGCGAGFAHDQLHLLSDKQSLEKLAQLQQEKDIRDAGLDNLEECPFCDYKAILPPVEEDFEFRCANPACEKISCRRCKAISHIPVSCEQHAKDNKINSRHKIEEAMTAALVRSCNKCKKQFIKEYGCNKMTCPSCGNLQCYVCSITLKDYNHFDQNIPGRAGAAGTAASKSKSCPLYDNVEERHEREVKEAETAARAQVVQDNPDVSPEDLEIKVSEAVKTATTNRIRQGGGPAGFMGFGAAPPPMPGAFGLFGADGMDDIPFLDFQQARHIANRNQNRAADRHRDAELLVNLRRRGDGYRPGEANIAPPPVPPFVAPQGPMQGYIPILGYQGAPPPVQQAAPALPRPQLQANVANAVPQNLGFQYDAFPWLADEARDVNWAAPPNQQVPFNNAAANRANEFLNHFGRQPEAAGVQAQAQGQQGFNPGIRDQRQNFQQLEMMRQQHQQQLLRRQQRQQEMMERQEHARQQLQGLQQQNRDLNRQVAEFERHQRLRNNALARQE